MNNTFINEDFVIETTSLQQNVKGIQKYIKEAQDLYIEIPIGKYPTSVLLSNYLEGRIITNSLEEEVVYYIQKSLAYYTVAVALPNIHYKLTENGVFTKDSGDNAALEPKDLEYRITMFKQNGTTYLNRAIDIMEKNSTKFPYLKPSSCNNDNLNRPKTYGGILFRR